MNKYNILVVVLVTAASICARGWYEECARADAAWAQASVERSAATDLARNLAFRVEAEQAENARLARAIRGEELRHAETAKKAQQVADVETRAYVSNGKLELHVSGRSERTDIVYVVLYRNGEQVKSEIAFPTAGRWSAVVRNVPDGTDEIRVCGANGVTLAGAAPTDVATVR